MTLALAQYSDTTRAGNITALNINYSEISCFWAGYYGNVNVSDVASPITLNAHGGRLENYNITLNCTTLLDFFVVTNSSEYPNVTNFTAGDLSLLDAITGVGPSSAMNTFLFMTNFAILGHWINNTPTLYTAVNGTNQATYFRQGYMQDEDTDSLVFAVEVEDPPERGYDSDYYNFQLMLPTPCAQDMQYFIHSVCEAAELNYTLPEGWYYLEPPTQPDAGNFKFNFTIWFVNATADAGRVLGCYVNQSNCYDPGLPGCTTIFVNYTLPNDISAADIPLTHVIRPEDILNSTLGGTTDNWIPWRITECGIYTAGLVPIKVNPIIWRIHVHPIPWTPGDIANAVNAKTLPNMFGQNTIKSDNRGDIAHAVAKYGGTKVELWCHDKIDNPDDSDTLIDCADPECLGITYSCLPKQEHADPSLYYSPSGSHGTLASDILPGDMAAYTTSGLTFNTLIEYTEHAMPNGTVKIRFRKWGLSKTATFIVLGLPDIERVTKSAAGVGPNNGEMIYFLDKDGHPRDTDKLENNQTYQNTVAIRSYLAGGTEINNLDTTVNISFADPDSINMSEGYEFTIVVNYVEDSTPFEERFNITVYFDDPTYGPPPRWDSQNENETDIVIDGVDWGVCNDTRNADFDYLNCPSYENICFDQASYDCYDSECDGWPGTLAWNDYTGEWTTGNCNYNVERECFDEYNNDWNAEDPFWGHANSALFEVDCRDLDCDDAVDPITGCNCEYWIEETCNDTCDNDYYNYYDCLLQPGGGINDAEYDCSPYCRSTVRNVEVGPLCDDLIDNDWDNWYLTTGGPTGYARNYSMGAGVDCVWLYDADEDCNLTNLSNNKRCELWHELTCDDEFSNDMDQGHGRPDPGWYASRYSETFGPLNLVDSADFDDYDCQHDPRVPDNESQDPAWCFDGVDNDLDAYYYVGSFNWATNASGGFDCLDPDCLNVTNPANESEICLPYEYHPTDPYFQNNSEHEPRWFCENVIDDDWDGPIDCDDWDCKFRFDLCGPCPRDENDTWDACANGFDDDYDDLTDGADPDCIGWLIDYDHHLRTPADGENSALFCFDGVDNDNDSAIDCADANCAGIGYCGAENCNDDYDNDGDGLIDCRDLDCAAVPACVVMVDMSGTYSPPTTTTATYGDVQVTWDSRVRNGTNYTVNLVKTTTYSAANLYIGRLTGSALPVGTGLQAPSFVVVGPDSSNFETDQYNQNVAGTKGQIEVIDQVPNTPQSGFDVSVEIPTNDALAYTTFEYFHSIDGVPSTGNMIGVIILDSIKPVVTKVITEPTVKNRIFYGGSIWAAASASDAENGDYEDGTIDSCFYSVAGPGAYSASGSDSISCKFSFGNLIDDGAYTLSVWARDDTGNIGDPNVTIHNVNLIPLYVVDSFIMGDNWYNFSEIIPVSAQFYTDDAASISNCQLYMRDVNGATSLVGNIPATNVGDLLTCAGSTTSPAADGMYELWINITDSEGDTARSGSETFFVCNSLDSSGIGTRGEIWDCKYADMDDDGIVDICLLEEIPEEEEEPPEEEPRPPRRRGETTYHFYPEIPLPPLLPEKPIELKAGMILLETRIGSPGSLPGLVYFVYSNGKSPLSVLTHLEIEELGIQKTLNHLLQPDSYYSEDFNLPIPPDVDPGVYILSATFFVEGEPLMPPIERPFTILPQEIEVPVEVPIVLIPIETCLGLDLLKALVLALLLCALSAVMGSYALKRDRLVLDKYIKTSYIIVAAALIPLLLLAFNICLGLHAAIVLCAVSSVYLVGKERYEKNRRRRKGRRR